MTEPTEDKGVPQSLAERLRRTALYPVVYMFLITFLFTAILIGIAHATHARVDANEKIMFERAVLMATLPDEVTDRTPSSEVYELFTQRVRDPDASSGGAYRVIQGERLQAYALPIDGQGFWDQIAGVIGIEPDMETITGIAFHQQKETPGLGAEIAKPYFSRRFIGRKLTPGDQAIALVAAGQEPGESEFQAITGATQTSTRLEKIINRALKEWRHSISEVEGENS